MMTRLLCIVALAATIAACASAPAHNSALDQARERFNTAQRNADVGRFAPVELDRARESLRAAEQAKSDGRSASIVDHLSYMTSQRVTIAQETASSRASEAVTAGAAAERDRMRLAARTIEADAAKRDLSRSQRSNAAMAVELADADANARDERSRSQESNAAMATALADSDANARNERSRSEASNAAMATKLADSDANARVERSRSEASNATMATALADSDANAKVERSRSEATNAALTTQLADSDANARAERTRSEASNKAMATALSDADAEAQRQQARNSRNAAHVSDLEKQLIALNAKKTDRGMVLTLGNVLFDTGQARLLPDTGRNFEKLASFFKRNPEQAAAVHGYTDNVGLASSNYDLSERRARAVTAELVSRGVASDHLTTQGHGADMPTASNSTSAGRQLNRRVEIVFAQPSDTSAMR